MVKRNRIIKRLVERDGPSCWICGREIEANMLMVRVAQLGNNSLAASIDHVIPVSKGGKNHISNKRIAHGSCNARRGNEEVTDDIVTWCRSVVERIKREGK